MAQLRPVTEAGVQGNSTRMEVALWGRDGSAGRRSASSGGLAEHRVDPAEPWTTGALLWPLRACLCPTPIARVERVVSIDGSSPWVTVRRLREIEREHSAL